MTRTLILELNELCPPLVDRYIDEGRLPNFAQLRERSEVYRTWTDDEALEPWVQWVTYHYGVPHADHGITHLNQGNRVGLPAMWDQIAGSGRKVLAFGPMNAATPQNKNVTMVPDAWTTGVETSADVFQPFLEFISTQIKSHHDANARIEPAEALRFLRFCLGHGLSASAAMAIARQILVTERISPHKRWQRALILDRLLWDVFEHAYDRGEYDTGIVFLDGVGHLQHKYWRQSFPEQFERETTEDERRKFGNTVLAGYELHDRLLGRAIDLVGSDGTLIVVGALSQETNLRFEDIGGRIAYKPRALDALLGWASCGDDIHAEPVMAHQAWAVAPSPERIADVAAALRRVVRADTGQPIFHVKEPIDNRVFFWCSSRVRIDDDVELRAGNGQSLARFGDLFLCIGEVSSSRHNREGLFWVAGPNAAPGVRDAYLPLTEATCRTLAVAA